MPKQVELSERNAEIFKARQAGETTENIGKRYGLTTGRVRQILTSVKARQARNSGPYKGLPPRIVKALKAAGITSLEEAQKMSELALSTIAGIGSQTAAEIKRWPTKT